MFKLRRRKNNFSSASILMTEFQNGQTSLCDFSIGQLQLSLSSVDLMSL